MCILTVNRPVYLRSWLYIYKLNWTFYFMIFFALHCNMFDLFCALCLFCLFCSIFIGWTEKIASTSIYMQTKNSLAFMLRDFNVCMFNSAVAHLCICWQPCNKPLITYGTINLSKQTSFHHTLMEYVHTVSSLSVYSNLFMKKFEISWGSYHWSLPPISLIKNVCVCRG